MIYNVKIFVKSYTCTKVNRGFYCCDPDSSGVLLLLLKTASLLLLSVDCCLSLSHWLAAVNMWLVQSPEPEGTKSSDGTAVGTTVGRGGGWLCKVISLIGKCVCVVVATGSVCCFYECSFPSHPPIALLLDCD